MVTIQFSIPILVAGVVCFVLGLLLALGAGLASDSKFEGVKILVLFILGFVALFLSWGAKAVRVVGYLTQISKIYAALFNFYPGKWFGEKVREDFVNESLLYVRQGVIEIEEREQEELIGYFKTADAHSGVTISDGEAALALILVLVGVFSVGPSWLLTAITVVLAVTVSMRLVSLDVLLYDIPESIEDTDRLEVMLAWNESMVNRVAFDTIIILRIFHDFDERLYWVYLRQILWQRYVHGSVSKPDLRERLLKQFTVIIESKMRGIDAEELSRRKYGKNVLVFEKAASTLKEPDLKSL